MDNNSNPAILAADAGDEPAGRPIPVHPDALLYPAEAAFLLGLSVRTMETARLRGGGVPFVSLGRRAVRYRRCDIIEFIEARLRKSTSDPGPAAPAPALAGGQER